MRHFMHAALALSVLMLTSRMRVSAAACALVASPGRAHRVAAGRTGTVHAAIALAVVAA